MADPKDTPINPAGVRTGKAKAPVDLPPYHNEETFKIAQDRASKQDEAAPSA